MEKTLMPAKKTSSSLSHHHHPVEVRTARERDHDTGTTRRRVQTHPKGATLTEQHHKHIVDINHIMARYVKSGTLDHVRQYEGQYADLPPGDFHDSMNKITEAESMFADLPSQLRRHFANNTSAFLEFCVSEDDPAGELARIAEEHRRQALGLPPGQGSSNPQDHPGTLDPKPGTNNGESGSETGQDAPASN